MERYEDMMNEIYNEEGSEKGIEMRKGSGVVRSVGVIKGRGG